MERLASQQNRNTGQIADRTTRYSTTNKGKSSKERSPKKSNCTATVLKIRDADNSVCISSRSDNLQLAEGGRPTTAALSGLLRRERGGQFFPNRARENFLEQRGWPLRRRQERRDQARLRSLLGKTNALH